jgi:hypothetical protein
MYGVWYCSIKISFSFSAFLLECVCVCVLLLPLASAVRQTDQVLWIYENKET